MYVIKELHDAEIALQDTIDLWDEMPNDERKTAIRGALIDLLKGEQRLAQRVKSGELQHNPPVGSIKNFTEKKG